MKKLPLLLALIALLGCTSCTSQSRQQIVQSEQMRFEQQQAGYPDRIAGDQETKQAQNARRQTMLGNK